MLGLGLALLASFALTGAGTAFAGVVLNAVGLGQVIGAQVLFVILTVAMSVAGMWLVFLWVIARLPREPVSLRSAVRAALVSHRVGGRGAGTSTGRPPAGPPADPIAAGPIGSGVPS